MHLISFRSGSSETLAVVAQDRWMAATDLLPGGPATMADLLPGGDALLTALRSAADPARIAVQGGSIGGLELLAPAPRPGKVVGIGRNCSESFTLEPGDVIATGTPGGVRVFRDPPRYLGDGDVVTVEIERIGHLVIVCRTERAKVRA